MLGNGFESQEIIVRRATPGDAPGIVGIWDEIVAEKVYSSIDRPFHVDEERAYIRGLSRREGVFLAERGSEIIGFQSLDLWARYMHSMGHVAQVGTFVRKECRGHGIGHLLAQETFAFARAAHYEKIVISVRASNPSAQQFYSSLGFVPSGRLARQAKLSGEYDDVILMEMFL